MFKELFTEGSSHIDKQVRKYREIESILKKAEKQKDRVNFYKDISKIIKLDIPQDVLDALQLMLISSSEVNSYKQIINSFRKTLSTYQVYRDEFGDFRKGKNNV